jgi:type I restriction enzyme S subunit
MTKYVELSKLIDTISKTHKFEKDELVFLNTSDVLEGKILINHYSKVSTLKGQAKKTIQNGDILYSEIRPKNRRYAYVKNLGNPEDYVVSTKLMVLRKKSEDLNNDYLYHFLTYNSTINYLQRKAENRIGSFPQITFSVLKQIKIWLPKISTQKQIAKVLSDLDAKIEINNKINQELEAMAKTLYDYWFVQFDFSDKNGKPYKSSGGNMVFNEELKREIPVGWENKKLSNFAECNKWNRTKESSYDKINYLDTSSLTRNVIESYQKLDFVKDKIPSRAQRIVSENDILYSTVRPNQLHYGIIKKPIENLIVSTGFAQIRSKDPKVTNDFIYQVLSQDYISIRLHQIAVGSVSAYPSISHNDIMNLDIAFPMESNLIEKATVIFQQYNEKIASNLEQNQKLSELRDWLLPMLMNGQVSVGYAEKEVEGLGLVAEGGEEYKK